MNNFATENEVKRMESWKLTHELTRLSMQTLPSERENDPVHGKTITKGSLQSRAMPI